MVVPVDLFEALLVVLVCRGRNLCETKPYVVAPLCGSFTVCAQSRRFVVICVAYSISYKARDNYEVHLCTLGLAELHKTSRYCILLTVHASHHTNKIGYWSSLDQYICR